MSDTSLDISKRIDRMQRDLLDEVQYRHGEVVITKAGKRSALR